MTNTFDLVDAMPGRLPGDGFPSRIVINGAACTVTVFVKEGMHRATWFCGACSDRSKVPFEDGNADAAIDAARSDLFEHHATAHPPQAQQRSVVGRG